MITLLLVVGTTLLVAASTRSRRRLKRLQRSPASGRARPRAGSGGDPHASLAPIPSPLLLELLAALLESGAPPSTALRHISAALARVGDRRATRIDSLAVEIEQGVVGPSPVHARGTGARPQPAATRRPRERLLTRARPQRTAADHTDDVGLDVLRDAVRLAASAGLPPAALVRRAAAEERRRAAAVRQRAIRRLEVLLVLPVGLCLLPAFVLLGIVPVIVDLLVG